MGLNCSSILSPHSGAHKSVLRNLCKFSIFKTILLPFFTQTTTVALVHHCVPNTSILFDGVIPSDITDREGQLFQLNRHSNFMFHLI